jgi:hypothetical protein
MRHYQKKASETTLMDGLRQRMMQTRHLLRVAFGSVALAILLVLFTPQASAAHPADTITFTFTVTVQAGTAPSDVLFWLCPDAQPDGTGCEEMNAQPDGTFTYQFTGDTGTTYQHVIIEWSHGRLPTSQGPIPAPPAHIACDYHPFTVSDTGPRSITCNADVTPATVTPAPSTPTGSPTPAGAADPSRPTRSGDNSTLITGLQIITVVGFVLLVLLLAILIWQRMSARSPGH